MKTLIIHAGLPKTGTSALQVFLARNRDGLIAQSIDYLVLGEFDAGRAGKISSGNAALLARTMLPADHSIRLPGSAVQRDALLRAVRASRCETGLISSEFFALDDPDLLRDFAAALHKTGLSVRLVYFVRAQDQLLASIYVQDVKRGWNQDAPETFVRYFYRDLAYLKHATFFETMAGIFGAANITPLIYEEMRDSEAGICTGFLDAIGAKTGGAAPATLTAAAEDINTGLSGAEIAVMRELNKYRPKMAFSDLLVSNSLQSGASSHGVVHRFLPADLVAEINAYFAAENAAFARRHFGRDILFPPRDETGAPPGNVHDISAQDMVSILGGLLVRYDERLTALEAGMAAGSSPGWRWLKRRLGRLRKRG